MRLEAVRAHSTDRASGSGVFARPANPNTGVSKTLLTHESLRPIGLRQPSATAAPYNARPLVRAIPGLLLAALLSVSAGLVHRLPDAAGAVSAPKIAVAKDLSDTPYDFAPSTTRQQVLDRREAGLPLPDEGALVLQEQAEANAAELEQERALVSKYFAEIQTRDSDIAKLKQTVDANQANLAKLAAQLGLPKDRIAPSAAPTQKGVGGPSAEDLAALINTTSPVAAAGAVVKSVQDLQALVSRYLNIWCPLPAGDARCGQAIDHARAQLAHGHGLDVNKPDASPVLNMDVAQPFGPTDLALEPLQEVNGQLVHFHDGVDLAAYYDEPVMAAAAGVVVFADVAPSGALTVEIAHAGGIHTVYMHEEQLLVTKGQPVEKGQIIGLVGATGMATGPHVHFMIKDPSGTPIDPLPFIQ